jgi:hypothetical protein
MQAQTNPALSDALSAYTEYCQTAEFMPEDDVVTTENVLMFHPVYGTTKHLSDEDFAKRTGRMAVEAIGLRSHADAIIAACKTRENCDFAMQELVKLTCTEFAIKSSVRLSINGTFNRLAELYKRTSPKSISRYTKIPRRVIRHSKEYKWAVGSLLLGRR